MGWNKAAMTIASAMLAALAAIALARLDIMEAFSLKALDWRFNHAASKERADKDIVLITVGQDSLDHFENDNIAWPWPRSLYNPIVDYVTAGGAEAVIFDILFTNLAPYGMDVDLEFAEGLKQSGNTGLAAFFGAGRKNPESPDMLNRFSYPFEGAPLPGLVKSGPVSLPVPEILQGPANIGNVHFKPDRDGVYRRAAPGIIWEGRLFPSLFAIPLFRQADGPVRFADGAMTIGARTIPLDEDGNMLINFAGPKGSYTAYPAAAVITSMMADASGEKPAVPKEAFQGKIVFIGYTAPGLYDLKPSPVNSSAAGMVINATALDTARNGAHLRPIGAAALWGVAFLGALMIAASFFYTPWGLALAVALAVMGGQLWLSVHLFTKLTLADPVSLLSCSFLAVVISAMWKYQTEGKMKREIRKAFTYYVSPKVVSQMLEEPERLKLGGERRELTILFADLEGFTTISEKLDPHDLFTLMNNFTTMMADTITEYDGAVDKYIGDAVMAFWNAPLDQQGHQALALKAALACQNRLLKMRDDLLAQGMPKVDMRIGVNSGMCMVGNMGSAQRFNYSALGDPVNLASRLEGLCKAYGVRSLVSEATWRASGGAIFGREIDYLMVKGKDEPVRVFEAMALSGSQTQDQERVATDYARLLELYRARQWAEAEKLGEDIMSRVEDGPSWAIVTRVRHYMEHPPPEDWDGSFRHTTK